ncbi:LysR family transcriptional regulator [Litoribacillus peritrichatus]|uniref:LysR family transcriptional regulator n=1 Tax=Litoribacillus peritrichatus TaxID=718191 RepID=A0ABP7MAE9_9GAMM
MTYEQLRVLHAVVNEGTFRSAAEKLFKSQPAISTMIKNLEEEIGISLFSRDSYRPKLTDSGRVFYEKSLAVIQQTQELASFAKRLSNYEEPLVTVSINAVCPLPPVLETLKLIEQEYPATQIRLTTEQMGGAIERLFDERSDLVITTQTGIEPDQMEAKPYKGVKIIPVAHHTHPLAQRAGMLSINDVKPHVQVIVTDSSQSRNKQSLDLMPQNRRWYVTDFAAKKDIIMAGMGWGGMPKHTIENELDAGELVQVYVDEFDVRHSQQYLIRRTDKPVGKVAAAIWDRLSETYSAT